MNGRPFQPERELRWDQDGRRGLAPAPARTVRLELDLDSAALGARSGDRIGVQILYSEAGWSEVHHDASRELPLSSSGAGARMTNRVEFTAP